MVTVGRSFSASMMNTRSCSTIISLEEGLWLPRDFVVPVVYFCGFADFETGEGLTKGLCQCKVDATCGTHFMRQPMAAAPHLCFTDTTDQAVLLIMSPLGKLL